MLTRHDIEVFEQTGHITRNRLEELQRGLRKRAQDARFAATHPLADERFAASLRGKANGYEEAITLIESILVGNSIPKPKRVRRAHAARRAERRSRFSITRDIMTS